MGGPRECVAVLAMRAPGHWAAGSAGPAGRQSGGRLGRAGLDLADAPYHANDCIIVSAGPSAADGPSRDRKVCSERTALLAVVEMRAGRAGIR